MVWLPINRFETVFDPFSDLGQLQWEINNLFTGQASYRHEFPGINIWSTAEQVVVTAEVPGVDLKDIGVTVTGNALTIEGERKPDTPGENDVWHRQERSYGRFVRTVRLPFEVEGDKIEAHAQNGLLMIRLPRKESTKPRRITIQPAT